MILVTGGTGLAGSNLLFDLLKENANVRALRRASANVRQTEFIFRYRAAQEGLDAEQMLSRIQWMEGDILNEFSLEPALEDVSLLYHCAAMVYYDRTNKKTKFRNNLEGT
jgi:nucleoside-diphosphate-sugar epimerase